MSGFYRMHRGWMDNPALGGAREPFCRRAAWCWLIERTAWKGTREDIGGKTIRLERGQLTASLRYMAKAWGWSEPAVRRFIERLKTDAMIDAATDAGQLVITICNYSRYQADIEQTDAATDAPTDAEATQDRRKREEGKEGKKDYDDGTRAHATDADAVVDHFLAERDRLWPSNPNFPSNRMTLTQQAARFLEEGGTVEIITATITATAEKLLAKGDPNPPTNLRFCERSIASRIATSATTTTGGPTHGYRHHSRPSDRIDADDRRRAILEA